MNNVTANQPHLHTHGSQTVQKAVRRGYMLSFFSRRRAKVRCSSHNRISWLVVLFFFFFFRASDRDSSRNVSRKAEGKVEMVNQEGKQNQHTINKEPLKQERVWIHRGMHHGHTGSNEAKHVSLKEEEHRKETMLMVCVPPKKKHSEYASVCSVLSWRWRRRCERSGEVGHVTSWRHPVVCFCLAAVVCQGMVGARLKNGSSS